MSNVDKVMLSNLLSNIPLQQDDILIKNAITTYCRECNFNDFSQNVKPFFFDIPKECEAIINDYLEVKDKLILSFTCFKALYVFFPFDESRIYVVNKICWELIDKNLNEILDKRGAECNANTIYSVFKTVNNIRHCNSKPLIPSVSYMLYSRYRLSIEPLLFLQSLIFNSTKVQSINFSVIQKGEKRCSFGENCRHGEINIVVLTQDENHGLINHLYLGEFVLCRKHYDCLKCKIRLL